MKKHSVYNLRDNPRRIVEETYSDHERYKIEKKFKVKEIKPSQPSLPSSPDGHDGDDEGDEEEGDEDRVGARRAVQLRRLAAVHGAVEVLDVEHQHCN